MARAASSTRAGAGAAGGEHSSPLAFGPNRPTDYSTKMAGTAYDPEATCPLWERSLVEWLPDSSTRHWLQKWFGYCLTGYTHEQILAIFYGRGANGKSVLINVLQHVFGSYAATVEPATFLDARSEKIRDDLADLRGIRLAITTEFPGGKALDEALVKRLTGGDRLRARHLYGKYFDFQPRMKIIIVTNHKPIIRGTDKATWRRIRMVPFDQTIPEAKQDRYLTQKLIAESSGILNWLLHGLELWRKEGLLTLSSDMGAAGEMYRAEMDPLGEFYDACVREALPIERLRTGKVWERYVRWCRETGSTKLLSSPRLIDEMRQRGIETVSANGFIWYKGITLVPTLTDQLQEGEAEE